MVASAKDYQQQILEAPRPPGSAYVIYFCLGTLAINTFYLVFEQEERRFWLWAALGLGFLVSWYLPRTARTWFHRIIDLGSVITLVWFIRAMTSQDEYMRFGNYLGQMVCVFLVLFSFRTFRHSDFSWLMVIGIVIMLLCSIPIYAASYIYSIFFFLLLLALGLLVLNLYPPEGDHREEEPTLNTFEWMGQFGRTGGLALGVFALCAGLFAGIPQGGAKSASDRETVRNVFGVGSLSAETRGNLSAADLEEAAGVQGGASYSGFSESFNIADGRSGTIQEDTSPILEVKAPGQPHMRALAWDVYTGRAWNRSEQALARTNLHSAMVPITTTNSDQNLFTSPVIEPGEIGALEDARRLMRAEIKLVGGTNTGQGFLFLPWRPMQLRGEYAAISIDDMETWKIQTQQTNPNEQIGRYTLEKGDSWSVLFEPASIQFDPQRPVPPLSDAEHARFTQLPETTPTSIIALGQSLRTGSHWDTALAIQRYLAEQKDYSLTPPVMGNEVADVVSFWLEESEDGGHCELFATSATVLLRAADIPARTVTGFAPGTFNMNKGAWIIRGKDAHAWVELFVPDIGWVMLDPTPASWGEDIVDSMSAITSLVSRNLEQYFIYDPRGFWTRDLPNHFRTARRQLLRTSTRLFSATEGGIPPGIWLLAGLALSATTLFVTVPFMRHKVPWGHWQLLRLRQTSHWSLRRYDALNRRLHRKFPELPTGLTLTEAGTEVAKEQPQLGEALRNLGEPFHHFHYEDPALRPDWLARLRAAWRKVPRI